MKRAPLIVAIFIAIPVLKWGGLLAVDRATVIAYTSRHISSELHLPQNQVEVSIESVANDKGHIVPFLWNPFPPHYWYLDFYLKSRPGFPNQAVVANAEENTYGTITHLFVQYHDYHNPENSVYIDQ